MKERFGRGFALVPPLCRELDIIAVSLFFVALVPAFYNMVALVQSKYRFTKKSEL